jgi:hypothetical protein
MLEKQSLLKRLDEIDNNSCHLKPTVVVRKCREAALAMRELVGALQQAVIVFESKELQSLCAVSHVRGMPYLGPIADTKGMKELIDKYGERNG